jgi:hypothetical protein
MEASRTSPSTSPLGSLKEYVVASAALLAPPVAATKAGIAEPVVGTGVGDELAAAVVTLVRALRGEVLPAASYALTA